MRKRPRKDGNHAEIVRAFERLGCTVLDLSQMGGGCPDLLISTRGRNVLVEVKDGSKAPSARQLTKAQAEFWMMWRGAKTIVRSLDDVEETVRGIAP